MRKKIQKPANWQDFESLCRMLWGEIWDISDKIKKNGRLGQPQAGVDVYGVPKGKIQYSGIQCKGKEDYLKSRLTKKEIDAEIKKAHSFQPKLETFILATTAEKDVKIEQYVREKDLESRTNGSFEILLFDWEDIADRIEVHRGTFNYYVLNNQFKSNFDCLFCFENGSSEIIIHPVYQRTTTKYQLKAVNDKLERTANVHSQLMRLVQPFKNDNIVNKSWVTLSFLIDNIGEMVIENYKLFFYPDIATIRKIKGYKGGLADEMYYLQHSPLYIFDDKSGRYTPTDDKPLIQKDRRRFDVHFLLLHDAAELKIEYELLARDFNKSGVLTAYIEPEIRHKIDVSYVEHEIFLRPDEESVGDYLVEIS